MDYEQKVRQELEKWEAEMMKEAWFLERLSKKFQQRVDNLIPEKVHLALSKAMEMIVKSILSGIDILPFSEEKLKYYSDCLLVEKDTYFDELLVRYKKIAAAEGVGTGVGGIALAAVDYPALIAIKMKFLAEAAQIYSFDIREFSERVFLLKVFQLAFSGDSSRNRVFRQIRTWNNTSSNLLADSGLEGALNWRDFYTEYKESIEFKKMLSFIPLVGSVISGWANYSLVNDLGYTVKNSYRLRLLDK